MSLNNLYPTGLRYVPPVSVFEVEVNEQTSADASDDDDRDYGEVDPERDHHGLAFDDGAVLRHLPGRPQHLVWDVAVPAWTV